MNDDNFLSYFQNEIKTHAKHFIYREGNTEAEVDMDQLWNDYLEHMKKCETYASDVEVQFMHRMLKKTIVVIMSSGEGQLDCTIKGQ